MRALDMMSSTHADSSTAGRDSTTDRLEQKHPRLLMIKGAQVGPTPAHMQATGRDTYQSNHIL